MYNRFKYIFGAILAFLLLFNVCTSCDLIEEGECTESGLYVTFTLDFGNVTTKTSGTPYTTEDYESYIADLTFYLVRTDGSGFIKIEGKDVGWNPDERKTNLIRLDGSKVGKYQVYVVSNTASSLTYSDSDAETLLKAKFQLDKTGCEKLWQANHFAMSSTNDTFKEDFASEVELIAGEHTESTPLNVTLTLDRLACKVIPSMADDCTYSFKNLAVYGSKSTYHIRGLLLNGAALINCTNSANLFQHWAKASSWTSGGTPDGYPEMLLLSPSSVSSYSMTSGYYNRWADYVSETSLLLNTSLSFSSIDTPLYCLENNSPYYSSELAGALYKSGHEENTKMKGRTTGVIFRVQALFKEGTYVTEDINHDDQIHAWGTDLVTGVTEGAQKDTPGSWTKADPGYAPITFYVYKSRYFADADRLLSAYPELGTDKSVSALRKQGVSVYEDGIMYYIYWIKDENYTDGGDSYYSVIRNTCYTLNVDSILRLGDDIPGSRDYDENDPIDISSSSLSASLVISSWEGKVIKETI